MRMTLEDVVQELRRHGIPILNTVIPRIAKYSRLEEEEDDVPLLSNLNFKNPNFTQAIRLDDGLAMSLLPPYLAAELLSAENDTLSAWFMNQYREALNDMRNNADGSFEPIPLPYGAF